MGIYFLSFPKHNPAWFGYGIAMFPIILGLAMVPLTMFSGIRIKDGKVTMIDCGRERRSVSLGEIVSVSVNGTSFVIRKKWDVIELPIGQQNDALLLAMLRHYRPDQQTDAPISQDPSREPEQKMDS
jgi:hypothetical protein